MEFLSNLSMTAVWAIGLVAFLAVEGLTVGLTAIWFALGALAALVCSIAGGRVWLQLVLFLLVSVVALIFTRPLVKKYINDRVIPSNANALIGKECRVTETIDNIAGTGAVYVEGKTWTARSIDDSIIEKDTLVTAKKIEGVKLIVEKI